jgi:hypothetical protein
MPRAPFPNVVFQDRITILAAESHTVPTLKCTPVVQRMVMIGTMLGIQGW